MITITTINNSWYFLGDLVIKPNSSSTYQEENLSKNQAKDLLESVSSKRVSLSSEDLIKVQDRYDSFKCVSNADLNEALNNKASLGADGRILSEQLPNITDISGNSATSSKLQTPVNIEISGDATSSPVSFDGSANISLPVTLGNTGVSSGTYNNSTTAITPLTIDSKGRITSTGSAVTITPAWSSISSKPTTISEYGITDAYTKTQVDSLIPAGGSGGYSGYGMTRPKFINGSSYYLTNVWHDYSFGWVPSCTYSSTTFRNDVYMVPFIPLQNCTVSDIGITTSLAFAGTIKFGFYSSGSDLKPNTRLFASSAFSTAVVNTLLSAPTGGISVTAGSVYWIALFAADTGNSSLTTITNNLFSIASSGYANTNSQVVAGYRFNESGLSTMTDLPISMAFAGYFTTAYVPRLVFKIS